jgi:hypothetical protein
MQLMFNSSIKRYLCKNKHLIKYVPEGIGMKWDCREANLINLLE